MASPSAVDFQALSIGRLRETRALIAAGEFGGAWYLCGYVQELALKACICKTLSEDAYPDAVLKSTFRTHQISELTLLAGLRSRLNAELVKRPLFREYWQYATSWSPDDRYRSKTEQEALDLLHAYTDFSNGVFLWLSQQW